MSNNDDVRVKYEDGDSDETIYEAVDEARNQVYEYLGNPKLRRAIRKIRSAMFPFCVLVFLALGLFLENAWGKAWFVFLLIPFSEIMFSAILHSGKSRVIIITMLVCICVYFGLAFFLKFKNIEYAWLKSLIVFLFVPIVSALVK